jgi:hypothetical protein
MKSNSCTIVSQGAGGYGQKKPMELFPARGARFMLKIDFLECPVPKFFGRNPLIVLNKTGE